jgi:hypothetical protein
MYTPCATPDLRAPLRPCHHQNRHDITLLLQIRVGKWVDTLQKQFYGTSFAYDKAIRVEVSQAVCSCGTDIEAGHRSGSQSCSGCISSLQLCAWAILSSLQHCVLCRTVCFPCMA